MSDPAPIIERPTDGKRGFVDGYEQGYQSVLEGLRRGLSREDIEESCEHILSVIRESIEDDA